MVAVDQFDVYLIQLDPVIGSEIQKTRPCIIVSPNKMNLYLNTIIIAPMTSTLKKYPSRVTVQNVCLMTKIITLKEYRLCVH